MFLKPLAAFALAGHLAVGHVRQFLDHRIFFFFVLFLLYSRTFPVIAQAEVKSILKVSGSKYKKLRENKMTSNEGASSGDPIANPGE